MKRLDLCVLRVTTACILVLGLTACSDGRRAGPLYKEGQQFFEKHDYRAAAIQLRNALEANPFHREAQLLIGLAYLELEDTKSAEKELRKARQLNVEVEKVVPPLARTFLLAGEPGRILDEIRIVPELSAEGNAAVHTARGRAHLALGQPKEADAAFANALKAYPEYADALVGQAQRKAAEPALTEALAIVERALAAAPGNVEGWLLKGELLRLLSRNEDAARAFSEALALRPLSFPARLSRAFALVEAAQYEAAQADIDVALKRVPRHPIANYLQALTEFRRGDYAKARAHLDHTLRSAPNYMPAVLVSGAVDVALGANQRAEPDLARFVRSRPEDFYARKLLALAYLRMNQSKRAIEVIAPSLEGDVRDPMLLGLAGEIYMRAGDYARAADLLQRAVAIDARRAELYQGLGMLRIAKGDANGAAVAFKQASTLDSEGRHDGDFLLVVTLLNNQEFDQALASAQELAKKQPKNPVARHLAGSAYLGKKDSAAARKSFEQALALAPSYFPAALALARLDIETRNTVAARKRLESVLLHDSQNWQAMLVLASLASRENKSKDALEWLERARRADDKALAPRLLLARHYLEAGQPQASRAVAFEAVTADPGNPEALVALGLAQIATKDTANAIATFQKLVSLAPKSAPALLRLASAYMAASKPADAEQAIGKALVLSPDSVDGKFAMGLVQLRLKRFLEAQKIAREMQVQHAKLPLGFVLEGDALLAQKKYDEAAIAYERAFEVGKQSGYLTRVYLAHAEGSNYAKGEQRLLNWLAQNPKDVPIRNFLAETYLKSDRDALAARQYEAVLKLAPENVVALNNLAAAYLKLNDRRALETAQKAHKLDPDHPGILDTLGWVLVQTGDAPQGLIFLERAAKAAPKSAEIRYHLAAALVKNGDRERARAIAKQIMESGAQLPRGEDPSKLLE
jgi:putative PEP-CTERM system TPR-repeat lipoprotein